MANFWQNLTPWKEEKGETFGTALQNFWGQVGKPTPPATSGITFGGAGKAPASQLPATTTWGTQAPRGVANPNPWAGAYAGGSGQIPIVNWNTPTTGTNQRGAGVWEEAGYYWYFDNNGNPTPFAKVPDTTVPTMTPYQQAQTDLANRQFTYQQSQTQPDYSLQIAQMQQQQNQAELAWQQQQWSQQQAQEQKNYLANLAAEPHSWLEYAAAAGQAPVIQPWMLPIESQQYSNLQAGQPIPGWTATNMQSMPQLINPSAQYLARMGPTARAQYEGYQQANLGQTPEETQWRLWNMAPPGGSMSLQQIR